MARKRYVEAAVRRVIGRYPDGIEATELTRSLQYRYGIALDDIRTCLLELHRERHLYVGADRKLHLHK